MPQTKGAMGILRKKIVQVGCIFGSTLKVRHMEIKQDAWVTSKRRKIDASWGGFMQETDCSKENKCCLLLGGSDSWQAPFPLEGRHMAGSTFLRVLLHTETCIC